MNNNIRIYNSFLNHNFCISPIQFIGNNHPYKIYTIINLCISSSLFISNYTIAKTSIFLYIIYIMNNNIYLIIIMLFFVLYPMIFIVLIHPFIIIDINNHLIYKSYNKGIIINNLIIIPLTLITFINMFTFFIFFIAPFVHSICSICSIV